MTKTRDKAKCAICGHEAHLLVDHLAKKHGISDPTVYLEAHPDAALWSGYFHAKMVELNRGTALAQTPRPRRVVDLATLFPTFGTSEMEISGQYPIFDTPAPLTPTLDPMYVFPEEQTLDVLAILRKDRRNRVYVCGLSGTGKTTLIFNLAAVCNAEVMEWNADSFQQRSTLIGHLTVKDGETVWEDGILPRAMARGCWLVINEYDIIDPHTANVLKPLLEDPPRLTILEDGGRVVRAHPDFRVIAVANTWGRGDSTGMFVNTHVQSDADVRRWSARVRLDYMTEHEETTMLGRYFPNVHAVELAKFVQVAGRVRSAFRENKIDKTFSPAELVNWIENWQCLGTSVHRAARISFLNAVEPDVLTAIGEMISAVFGQEALPGGAP